MNCVYSVRIIGHWTRSRFTHVAHPRIYVSRSHALHEGAVARRRALHFERYDEEPSRRTRYCSMIIERLRGVVPWRRHKSPRRWCREISRQQPPRVAGGNIHRLGVKRIATLTIATLSKLFWVNARLVLRVCWARNDVNAFHNVFACRDPI